MATITLGYMPLFVLLYLLIFIQSSSSNDLVNKVCVYNDDPTYCTAILNSDGRTPNADLTGLGEISIDLGLVLATNISNEIIWKNNSATNDPRLTQCFNTCFNWYDTAKDSLVNASDALSSKAYYNMQDYAGSAGQFGLWCEEAFKQPPPRQSPLTTENNNFYHLTQAMVVISDSLIRGF